METNPHHLPTTTKIFLCASQFLYGSANACYYAYLAIWLSYNNFTYSQIGYIRGLNQLSILLFVPLLCLLVDVLSNNNTLYKQFLFSLITMITALSRLLFVYYDHSWNLIFCILIVVIIALQESANSTMDSIILSMISNPNKYGRYRLWAGVGWALNSFLLGYILDRNHLIHLSINKMFYFFAAFMGSLSLIWFISLIINIVTNKKKNNNHSSLLINRKQINKQNLKKNMCSTFYLFFRDINPFKMQIILSFLVLGVAYGVINTFLFLRLQQLGGSTVLMGITLIITVCSEMPAFYFVDIVLDKIGDLGVISIGMFAYIIRLSWYGLLGLNGIMSNPWYVLPAELLHGLTFAWIKASMAIFAYRLTNNNTELSSFSQGLLSAIFNGIGQGLGGVVGGIIFNQYGPHYLFFGTALATLPLFIIFTFQFFYCRKPPVEKK